MKLEDYAIRIKPLPDEGGGLSSDRPDPPGCVADEETIAQAVSEAHDAFEAWAMTERRDKGELPVPATYRG